MEIQTRIEKERGCGYRKPGGMYLVSRGLSAPCGVLPMPLSVCACCGHGVRPARGFTWINGQIFDFSKSQCEGNCLLCPLPHLVLSRERMGLIWIGEKFYSTPKKFTDESRSIGVSRRISQVPKDLIVGQTWVCVAHRKAVTTVGPDGIEQGPGVFQMFKPERIEYVVTGNESPEKLENLVKRGITLIKVIRDIDAQLTINQS